MAQNTHGSEAAVTPTRPVVREHAHPTSLRYVAIACILAIITIIEVAIAYLDFFGGVLIPVLLVLSAAKFILVAMFYMHLRFDSRLFSAFFVTGLLLAATIIITLLALFRALL